MGSDGRILSKGTVSEALAKNRDLALKVADEAKNLEFQQEIVDESLQPQASGKLVVAEEIDIGHVSRAACKQAQTFGVFLWH